LRIEIIGALPHLVLSRSGKKLESAACPRRVEWNSHAKKGSLPPLPFRAKSDYGRQVHSHRYAMIAAIAEGQTRIRNFSTGADCHSTLGCGARARRPRWKARERSSPSREGLDGLRAPAADLDAGNSGSTIRMLSGILAAQPFRSRIFGDESLSRRPMQRIMQPLGQMGARISCARGPVSAARNRRLAAPAHRLYPAGGDAQVKTCVLFAGLFAEGATSVAEPARSRDHTEIALREFGRCRRQGSRIP